LATVSERMGDRVVGAPDQRHHRSLWLASSSPSRLRWLELPGKGTGRPAAISAPTVRSSSAVRLCLGSSRSPYRSQAPSLLGVGPTARAGLVPPIARLAGGGCERRTGRPAGAGPLGLADRRFSAVVSRSYRPDRGSQLVPGAGWYRPHAGTNLQRLGDFGDRIITSGCSSWPSPATAVETDSFMRAPATAEPCVI